MISGNSELKILKRWVPGEWKTLAETERRGGSLLREWSERYRPIEAQGLQWRQSATRDWCIEAVAEGYSTGSSGRFGGAQVPRVWSVAAGIWPACMGALLHLASSLGALPPPETKGNLLTLYRREHPAPAVRYLYFQVKWKEGSVVY